ncbi:MAG: ABC-2 transporter permease [Firmicutes bacterium]|nr:ABC-2 transporter permease [Bacillota bacterium]
MYRIVHLIRRDLMLQKGQRTLLFAIVLSVVAGIVVANSPAFAVGTIMLVAYLMTVYVNAYDFKYNAELGYRSLPVPPATLIISRYLAVVVFAALSLGISIAASLVLRATGVIRLDSGWTLPLVTLTLSAVGLYFAVFFPLYYKLGYMSSRWVNYFLMIGLYIGLGRMQSSGPFSPSIDAPTMREQLSALDLGPVLLAALVLFILSMLLSIRIDRSREL